MMTEMDLEVSFPVTHDESRYEGHLTGSDGSFISHPKVDGIWLASKHFRGPFKVARRVREKLRELLDQVGVLLLDVRDPPVHWILEQVEKVPHGYNPLLGKDEIAVCDGICIAIWREGHRHILPPESVPIQIPQLVYELMETQGGVGEECNLQRYLK